MKADGLLAVFIVLISISVQAQYKIQGRILTADDQKPLAQVHISFAHQKLQTTTKTDGYFTIISESETSVIIVEKEGYKSYSQSCDGAQNIGTIFLEKALVILDEIILNAPAKEQIAQGIITYDLPQSKTGPLIFAQESTHVFKTIPSVYQSSQGGGEGDSSIKYRGFDSSDTRFSINGISVNDMESHWVYWSNWSNIMAVAQDIKMTSSTMGTLASQPSQGGQILINTLHKEARNFTTLNVSAGSDPSIKTSIMHHHYNPNSDGHFTAFLGRKSGNGFVEATRYKNYTYYLDFTKNWQQHSLSGFVFGAPQWHQQRSDYVDKMATLQDYLNYGTDYNYNYGTYKGDPMTWTENYFHKNINGLQWTWQYNPTGKVSTLVYSSFANGGGTYEAGSYEAGSSSSYVFANHPAWRDATNGYMMWDKIQAFNTGVPVTLSNGQTMQRDASPDNNWINTPYGSGYSKVSFTNKHYWLGGMLTWDKKLNHKADLNVNYQYRHNRADNFDRLIDLLGADGFMPSFDLNNQGAVYTQTGSADLSTAWNLTQKVDEYDQLNFHYRSLIDLHTIATSWSYTLRQWNFNTNLLWTTQHNKRTDFFHYTNDNNDRTSEKVTSHGWQIGQHLGYDTPSGQLFVNLGFVQKPSRFDQLFLNYKNDINPYLTKERISSIEAGHLYNKGNFNWTNVVYFIAFKDRYLSTGYQNPDTGASGALFFNDVNQQHIGLESSIHWTINPQWSLDTYAGIAQWEYRGKAKGNAYDTNQQLIDQVTLNLNGKKVGDAAQISGKFILGYKPHKRLNIYLNYQYNDGLYAKLNVTANTLNDIELPAYHLVDFETNYNVPLKSKNDLLLSLSVHNLLNSTYISTGYTSYGASNQVATWRGVPVNNKVFFGLQRYGFLGLKYVLK